jgi:hypothetical protein
MLQVQGERHVTAFRQRSIFDGVGHKFVYDQRERGCWPGVTVRVSAGAG